MHSVTQSVTQQLACSLQVLMAIQNPPQSPLRPRTDVKALQMVFYHFRTVKSLKNHTEYV